MLGPSIDLWEFIPNVARLVSGHLSREYRRTPERVDGKLGHAQREVAFTIRTGEILLRMREVGVEETAAFARSSQLSEAVQVTAAWLAGESVEYLWSLSTHVDRQLRELADLEDRLREVAKGFSGSVRFRRDRVNDELYELWVDGEGGERAVLVTGHRPSRRGILRKSELTVSARFYWGAIVVFPVTNTLDRVASLIERWVCQNRLPTQLESEFPWLDVGPRARMFEQTDTPIEADFEHSWSWVRDFFADGAERNPDIFAPELVALIEELHFRDYPKRLRAGQSLSTFIASRSRTHGLDAGQSRIELSASRGKLQVRWEIGADSGSAEFDEIAVVPRVVELMDALAELPLE